MSFVFMLKFLCESIHFSKKTIVWGEIKSLEFVNNVILFTISTLFSTVIPMNIPMNGNE